MAYRRTTDRGQGLFFIIAFITASFWDLGTYPVLREACFNSGAISSGSVCLGILNTFWRGNE